jgi:hypothetical protein
MSAWTIIFFHRDMVGLYHEMMRVESGGEEEARERSEPSWLDYWFLEQHHGRGV